MKKFACFLFLVVTMLPAFGQSPVPNWPDQLKQYFRNYSQKLPEKLYLHTDRSVYASADTVWFKAYLLDAKTNALHPLPEILYLDLISDKNVTLISQRLQTTSGFKAGSLILPDTLKTGSYQLRAYTNYQRNAGAASYFRKELFVNKVPQQKTPGNSDEKVLQEVLFFSESGKLISGLESKIAFKGVASDGSVMPVEGKILDDAGLTVGNFRSNKNGYGSFLLKPQPGKMYRAQVNGSRKPEFALPVAEKGYALSLQNRRDSLVVYMAAAEKNDLPLHLVLQNQKELLFTDTVKFNANGLRKRTFTKQNWPEGIMQANLFSSAGTAENERTFYNQRNPLKVTFEADKKIYGRREPVQLNFILKDAAGNPIQTELSVAVSNKLPDLGADLRSTILANAAIPEVNVADLSNPNVLDDMLLTQPAAFNWSAILKSENQPPAFAREIELNRIGKVTAGGNAIGKVVIYLLETNSGETHLVVSDDQGQFRIPLSGSRFFYQVWQNGIWRQEANLQLVNAGNISVAENWTPTATTDSALTNQFKLRRQIDMMYLREAEAPKFTLVNKDMWPSYAADKHYPLAEYSEFNTMEEILKEMVPEVRVVTRKKQVQANVYDNDRRIFFPHQPLYIIDGQPTWNNDLFLRLDASQLEQVNIYNSDKTLKNFGFLGNQGVIVVFTKSRNYQNPDLSRENILKVPGQFENTQFKQIARPANVPDFRPTIFWNPMVQTNAEGKATINFRTTDELGDLKVKVEGVTKDGQLISEEFLVPVKIAQ